jgi:S-adenosylmethionine synthetase|tara:strand:+ start:5836 stop:6084 length:249 start_codon:yes stop_codon:yes gene_type:complete
MKKYRVRNAKKKNYVIRIGKVYDMVADSLAVTTKDRSAKRIKEALVCCLTALKKDGHWFERPVANAAIRTIQKKLDKHPDIQ